MAFPRRFSNRLIYTILKSPLAAGEEPRSISDSQEILPLAKVALKAHAPRSGIPARSEREKDQKASESTSQVRRPSLTSLRTFWAIR